MHKFINIHVPVTQNITGNCIVIIDLYAIYGLEFYHGAVNGPALFFDIEHSRLGRKPTKIVTDDPFDYTVSSLVLINSIA